MSIRIFMSGIQPSAHLCRMGPAILLFWLASACSPPPIHIDGMLLVKSSHETRGVMLSLYPNCNAGETCPPYHLCSAETLAANLPSPIRSSFAENAGVPDSFYRVRVSGRPLQQENPRCDFEIVEMIEAQAVSPEASVGWRGE